MVGITFGAKLSLISGNPASICMCSVAKMELFCFIVICEGRVWTVKFILYHQLEGILQDQIGVFIDVGSMD